MNTFDPRYASGSVMCKSCRGLPAEVGDHCGLCEMVRAAAVDDVPRVYGLAQKLGYRHADVMKVLRAANANRKAA